MPAHALRPLALAATLAACLPCLAADGPDAKAVAFAAALEGDWTGSLEYRDYSTDKRVSLPTTLEARPLDGGRAASLKFRYDEGKGRFVEGVTIFRVDPGKNTLAWKSEGSKAETEYALTGLDAFAEKRKGDLVLTGLGTENGVPVEARQTITLDGEALTILKETRKPGGEFAFRNAYKFKKSPPPAASTSPPAP